MFNKNWFQCLLTALVVLLIQSSQGFAQMDENAQDPLPAQNTTIVSEEEFLKLQKSFDSLKPTSPVTTRNLSGNYMSHYPAWYCVAQSYWSGNWYYWLSPNLNYARYRALNACTFYNGYTCYVNCQLR
jgi:hypothetical protein